MRSSDPQFHVAFAPVAGADGEFVLTVTPPATATNFAVLTIRYRLGGPGAGAESELSAVARTLPPKDGPQPHAGQPQS